MSTFSSISIPIPKDWQAFERQSRILFECILADPQTQTNGRHGQRQNGVDIFGRRGGGNGPLVGVQCKGKDGNYGKPVTDAELRREVKEAQKFKPPLKEFILITTARDDQNIQTTARLIEKELQDEGLQISIAVWGWDTLEQRIAEHDRAIKAFSPDATPYTDKLLEGHELIIQSQQQIENKLNIIIAQHQQQTVISTDTREENDAIDKLIHDEIDQYRTLIQNGKTKTSLSLLETLKKRVWDRASTRIRFRILSNMGAAYHNMGNYSKAAELFIEAAPYDPDNPIGISNKIAALLIKGEKANAHAIAMEATKRFPNSTEIALQRILARESGEIVADVCGALPETVRYQADTLFVKIIAMRDDSDPNWREEAHRAISAYPDDDRIRRIDAEAFLGQFLEQDPALLGSHGDTSVSEEKLRSVASVFQDAWDKSLTREDGEDASAAHNGAVLYFVLRLKKEAIDLADAVISRGIASDETKKMRANFYLQDNYTKEAINLIQSIKPGAERDLWLAQVLVETDALQARELLEKSEVNFTDDRQHIGAAEIIVDSFIKESNFSDALAKIEKVNLRLLDHPVVPLLKYRVLSAQNDKSAEKILLEARDRLLPNADFVSRYLVAKEFEIAGLHDEASSILEGHVDLSRDSSALRLFITSAFNADRRATVAATISQLPKQVADREFFMRIKIAFSLRCGEIHEAEAAVRKYLVINPRNLEMHNQLLQILVGRDDKHALRTELSRSISDFDGAAEDWMQHALFLDTYGDWQKASALAYSIWLRNQNNPVVNFRYVALFLRPGHSTEIPITLDAVVSDSAFGIRRIGQDERQQFVIETDEALRSEPYTVSPTHPIATAALGKRVGDKIDLGVTGQYYIEWIKPKYVHVLHNVMETFNLFFPETKGLQRATIKTEGPEKFKPIADSAKARHEAIAQVFDMYEKQHLPIATIAAVLGSDPVETFLGLIENQRPIRVCVGTQPERSAAQIAIESNKNQGCIVDAITLHIIRRLKIENEVQAICGRNWRRRTNCSETSRKVFPFIRACLRTRPFYWLARR